MRKFNSVDSSILTSLLLRAFIGNSYSFASFDAVVKYVIDSEPSLSDIRPRTLRKAIRDIATREGLQLPPDVKSKTVKIKGSGTLTFRQVMRIHRLVFILLEDLYIKNAIQIPPLLVHLIRICGHCDNVGELQHKLDNELFLDLPHHLKYSYDHWLKEV